MTLASNPSARQLQRADLLNDVAAALSASGLAPSQLMVEITESGLVHEIESSPPRLEARRALGVRLASDDFGTGHSSLSYLQRLPGDTLKIDKSFVDDAADRPVGQALVRAIVQLSQALGLTIVAEGVEITEQADQLRALDCNLAQGYYFHRPLTSAAVETWLAGVATLIPTARGAFTSRRLAHCIGQRVCAAREVFRP